MNPVDFASKESMINVNMTTKQAKKLEKMANESLKYAHRAMAKSNELQAVLSLLAYKAGDKKYFTSARSLFKKLKI